MIKLSYKNKNDICRESHCMFDNVLRDTKISSTSKLIHCLISSSLMHGNEYFCLSNKQIAEIFGLSKTTVSIKIAELIKAGYLKSHTVQIEAFPGADYTIAERRLTW